MKFTQVRIAKLGETEIGEIYKGITHNFYELKEDTLPVSEQKFAVFLEKLIQRKTSFSELINFDFLSDNFSEKFREEIISVIEINNLLEKLPSKKIFRDLLESLIRLISNIDLIKNKALFAETVLHNSIGLKQLSFFSLEKDFEELMINGLDEVFIFHRKFGMCKVNIILNEKMFSNVLQKIAYSIGKNFDSKNPLLDARLPDGSRVNATFDLVSPRGISLTIRKFTISPLSILDLIKNNTLTIESAAFLWMCSDGFGINPKNILVVGGTASGKTTLLTVLSNFIRLSDRIISIEDTLELSLLDRENWVSLEAKHIKGEEVTMNDLLKNSLRMRPDRIIVGEVRGKEALTLFTAMNNGHTGCLGTIHANSAREAITKLKERPFEVPESLLPLVDLIVVARRIYSKEKGFNRQVIQIAEVTRMDNKVLLANVFEIQKDNLVRTNLPSYIIEEMARENSMEKNDLKKEMQTRALVLEWLLKKGLTNSRDILEVIQSYYYDPEKVLSMVYDN